MRRNTCPRAAIIGRDEQCVQIEWTGLRAFSGYSLVAFENRGVVNVLVSDLREDELLPLALAARRG